MKKIFSLAIVALGMMSVAYSQTETKPGAASNNEECYYYSSKEGNTETIITVNMTVKQTIAVVTIKREIAVEGKDKTTMSQKVDFESTIHNGKIFYSSQKAIAKAEDGSLDQPTDNTLFEQEIKIVDANTIIVDGKTLKKGNCK